MKFKKICQSITTKLLFGKVINNLSSSKIKTAELVNLN